MRGKREGGKKEGLAMVLTSAEAVFPVLCLLSLLSFS